MNPIIFHLSGQFSITWYGFFLVLGVSLFVGAVYFHPGRRRIVSDEAVFDIASAGLLGGLIGGKVLYLIQEWNSLTLVSWHDFLSILLGGLAILGAMLGATIGIMIAAHRYAVRVPEVLDFAGAYALIAHGVARFGCFVAGCCHGVVALNSFGSVVYFHPAHLAPLHVPLVPVQIFMALASLAGFVFCRFLIYPLKNRPRGSVFLWYVLWESSARFVLDFWRGDRPIAAGAHWSFYQYVAIGMIAATGVVLLGVHLLHWRKERS